LYGIYIQNLKNMKKNHIKKIIKECIGENTGEEYFTKLYSNAPNKKFADDIITYLRNKQPKDIELLVDLAINNDIKKNIEDWDIDDWYMFNNYVDNMEYFDRDNKDSIEKDLY